MSFWKLSRRSAWISEASSSLSKMTRDLPSNFATAPHTVAAAAPNLLECWAWTSGGCSQWHCPNNLDPQHLSTTAITHDDPFTIVHAFLKHADRCARHLTTLWNVDHCVSCSTKSRNHHSFILLGRYFEVHNKAKTFLWCYIYRISGVWAEGR